MSMYKKVQDFKSYTTAEIRLRIGNMNTLYDGQVIKRELTKHEGIKDVEIYTNKKIISVKYYPNIIDGSVIGYLILKLGYKLQNYNNKPAIKVKGG
ncbi:MAG: hypothetical protein APF76_10450 [Desulfitibacter sp. BRH_c19]|nr:MAG: hypothetical protein APF76_10450 [Desulfitibacter sp. BRH_c19]